jgi:hypothetical protein
MKDYFIQLSKDYPLAYAEFEGVDGYAYANKWDKKNDICYPSSLRDLYDWFDGIGIYISVLASIGSKRYSYIVDWRSYNMIDTRQEAEREAFTKAFEIREEQLKAKQKPIAEKEGFNPLNHEQVK